MINGLSVNSAPNRTNFSRAREGVGQDVILPAVTRLPEGTRGALLYHPSLAFPGRRVAKFFSPQCQAHPSSPKRSGLFMLQKVTSMQRIMQEGDLISS
jgi:hypothetical protein